MNEVMKKIGFMLMAVGLVAFLATGSFAAEQKEVTLKFTKPGPPTGARAEMDKWFAEEITKRTNGKVKFEFFWSGTLLNSRDSLKGIGRGVADVGEGSALFSANEYPYWSALNVAGTSDNEWVIQRASYDAMVNNPGIAEELAQHNVVPASGYCPGAVVFCFKKPATTMAEMKGLRFRSVGKTFAMIVKELGMVPVGMPLYDVYESLDKGVIDGTFAAIQYAYNLKWGEVAPYWSEIEKNKDTAPSATVFNKKVWDSFTDETRSIITGVIQEYNDKYAKAIIDEDQTARKALQASGVTFSRFSPEAEKNYLKGGREAAEEWWNEWDSKGMHTKAAFEQFMGYVDKYEKEFKEKGYPWDR